MKIAILGGSFDPPHLGHIFIARQIKEFCGMNEVWFMPLYQPKFDKVFQKNLTGFTRRFEMAKLLEEKNLKVSDFEEKFNPASITINTLDLLTRKYPSHSFYWISGSDQLLNFKKYDKWQEIIKNHNIIFFPREYLLPDFEKMVKKNLELPNIPQNVILLQDNNLILTNISSTMIRNRIKAGLSIHNFVLEEVEKYIYKNKLYL